LSRGILVETAEQSVEERDAFGLVVLLGVFSLSDEGGPELDGGLEVVAGLAGTERRSLRSHDRRCCRFAGPCGGEFGVGGEVILLCSATA
jgi:hypothetical protein